MVPLTPDEIGSIKKWYEETMMENPELFTEHDRVMYETLFETGIYYPR